MVIPRNEIGVGFELCHGCKITPQSAVSGLAGHLGSHWRVRGQPFQMAVVMVGTVMVWPFIGTARGRMV